MKLTGNKIIAVMNQKGGVGKSTISFNLAKRLSERDYKVLAIDNDSQSHLTNAFLEGSTELQADILDIYQGKAPDLVPQKINDNLFLIGATIHLAKIADSDFDIIFRLREGIENIQIDFDFVIIDCMPSFNYLHMEALNAADFVIVPSIPSSIATVLMKDLFEDIGRAKRRLNTKFKILGIILNLVKEEKTDIDVESEEIVRKIYNELVFDAVITEDEKNPAFKQSIVEYDPKSKQAQEFNLFLDEFLKRYGNQK